MSSLFVFPVHEHPPFANIAWHANFWVFSISLVIYAQNYAHRWIDFAYCVAGVSLGCNNTCKRVCKVFHSYLEQISFHWSGTTSSSIKFSHSVQTFINQLKQFPFCMENSMFSFLYFPIQGHNLRGKEFNLTLHWHVMPKTGKMFANKIVMSGYRLPEDYR